MVHRQWEVVTERRRGRGHKEFIMAHTAQEVLAIWGGYNRAHSEINATQATNAGRFPGVH